MWPGQAKETGDMQLYSAHEGALLQALVCSFLTTLRANAAQRPKSLKEEDKQIKAIESRSARPTRRHGILQSASWVSSCGADLGASSPLPVPRGGYHKCRILSSPGQVRRGTARPKEHQSHWGAKLGRNSSGKKHRNGLQFSAVEARAKHQLGSLAAVRLGDNVRAFESFCFMLLV